MRRSRLVDVGNDFLQALAVLAVSSLVGLGMWYWLWPFGMRLESAVVAGVGFGLFCALGSYLRSHDIEWEREHTKALPLNMRRARRGRRA